MLFVLVYCLSSRLWDVINAVYGTALPRCRKHSKKPLSQGLCFMFLTFREAPTVTVGPMRAAPASHFKISAVAVSHQYKLVLQTSEQS